MRTLLCSDAHGPPGQNFSKVRPVTTFKNEYSSELSFEKFIRPTMRMSLLGKVSGISPVIFFDVNVVAS